MFGNMMNRERVVQNWFWPVFAALVGTVWLITRSSVWRQPDDWEVVILFDFLVTIPVLFILCYRKRFPFGALALRIIGLQCVGILIASWLVPAETQQILPHLAVLRIFGIVMLGLIELRLMIAVMRLVFAGDTKVETLTDKGAPEWIARLMLLEARFWRWVFKIFRR